MKQILPVLCFLSLLAACNKHTDAVVFNGNEGDSKLMSITTSDGDDTSILNLSYQYTGNQITDIYRLFKNRIDSFHFAHLEYLANNHIKVTDPSGQISDVDFFLTDSSLPLQIVRQVTLTTQTTVLRTEETIRFLYREGTNLLDSISDSIPGAYYNMHYKFSYEGDNISDATITQSFPGGSGDYHLHCTYDISTPNIFRHTHPLLYLLQDPFFYNMSNYYIPSQFLVTTFSASTFRTLDFTGSANDPYSSYTTTLHYTLTGNGNIATIGDIGYSGLVYTYQ